MKRFIGLMNAYSSGLSGGDVKFIEILKYSASKYQTLIVTSALGKNLIESYGIKTDFIITSKEKEFHNAIASYLIRIIGSLKFFLYKNIPCEGDIIYSSSDFLPDVLTAVILKIKKRNAKYVQQVFHFIPKNRAISYLAQRTSLVLIKHFSDLTIVDNKIIMNDLLKSGFEKIKLNQPGIDIKKINSIKSSTKIFDAVFVGRLHQSKGIFDLVTVWKNISKNHRYKLVMIGEGNKETTNKLKTMIKKEGLNNIFLLGYLNDKEKYKVMKSSKIFLSMSYEEGFGISVIEAMACGLPVIAWNLPAYENTVYKITIGDKNKFSQAILKFLGDEKLIKKYSEKGKKIAEKYDWEKTTKRELKLINKE